VAARAVRRARAAPNGFDTGDRVVAVVPLDVNYGVPNWRHGNDTNSTSEKQPAGLVRSSFTHGRDETPRIDRLAGDTFPCPTP
jgi:hypothetical protein